MKHTAKKICLGEYLYRGFEISNREGRWYVDDRVCGEFIDSETLAGIKCQIDSLLDSASS